MTFNATYGATDVSLGDVVSFSGKFLTLNDGSKLKGNFSNDKLTLETAHGKMNLPFGSITSIVKASGVANPVAAAPAPASPTMSSSGNGASLTGKVFDIFGKPLAGVSVSVRNTRFSTTTDSQGNYSLGYVPGTIQVIFSKGGYYTGSLKLQIVTPSVYPVHDFPLFKELPGPGIFFIGESNYVASAASVQSKKSEIGPELQRIIETEYFVSGTPAAITGRNGKFVFAIKFPEDNDNIEANLYRVSQGNVFLRQIPTGGGGFKRLADEVKSGRVGAVRDVGSLFVWEGSLDPGLYVFASKISTPYTYSEIMGHVLFYKCVSEKS